MAASVLVPSFTFCNSNGTKIHHNIFLDVVLKRDEMFRERHV